MLIFEHSPPGCRVVAGHSLATAMPSDIPASPWDGADINPMRVPGLCCAALASQTA